VFCGFRFRENGGTIVHKKVSSLEEVCTVDKVYLMNLKCSNADDLKTEPSLRAKINLTVRDVCLDGLRFVHHLCTMLSSLVVQYLTTLYVYICTE